MANANQVRALLKSIVAGDEEHFVSVALQIAASEAKAGRSSLAEELRELVDEIKRNGNSTRIHRAVPITKPTGELAGLLTAVYPLTRFSEMVLNLETLKSLERIRHEFRASEKLRIHGLQPRRKILLVGPPGCGKTMTATALAGELKLPLFNVQLHGVITKFMGETATKLRMIFDAMQQTRGVYFFDEFDAIGAERGAANDVGEIRRVLNSFLQFLEQDNSESLILAATNFGSMLDEALFRRFDDIIVYNRPNEDQSKQLLQNRLGRYLEKRISWTKILSAAAGLSHAEISKASNDALKYCILNGINKLKTPDIVSFLMERHRS
ncbi:MAG TPA: AAA family ATPase [Oligoflexia bacterium]|nr:AAA family ATPase [Oligoflexia bacterium]HMP49111.1 AAA family ATPase [Oligoflexia bacterium]